MRMLLWSTGLAVGLSLVPTSAASGQGIIHFNPYVYRSPAYVQPNVAYTMSSGIYSPAYGYSQAYGYSPAYGYSAAYGYSPAYMFAPRITTYYPGYSTVYRYNRWP